MLRLDEIGPDTPHLPNERFLLVNPAVASVVLHAIMALTIVAVAHLAVSPALNGGPSRSIPDQECVDLQPIVFPTSSLPHVQRGGGGGGNRQAGPVQRAEGIGSDAMTVRARRPASAASVQPALPALDVDVMPLTSGMLDQIGLPVSSVLFGASTGPGFGGGVGTGSGTGIGSGSGAGIGPGTGGGSGGAVYRPGDNVISPRVIVEVKPQYTNEALLRRIQGAVVLQAVVTRDGRATQIQVIRSLDPEGLDQQAVDALAEWRFEPGRLAGLPVDVVVTVILDFWIR